MSYEPGQQPEEWRDRVSGRIVVVVLRERSPNGLTKFRYLDTEQESSLRHPQFRERFEKIGDA